METLFDFRVCIAGSAEEVEPTIRLASGTFGNRKMIPVSGQGEPSVPFRDVGPNGTGGSHNLPSDDLGRRITGQLGHNLDDL